MDLNKVMLIGNVTKDPESKTLPSGQQVVNFSVATNFTWKDQAGQKQSRAEFHNVVAFRKLAEVMARFLKRGSRIYLEGRLQTRSWDDPSGNKRYRTEILADNMIMLDRLASNNESATDAYSQESPASASDEAIEEINVEDIPF